MTTVKCKDHDEKPFTCTRIHYWGGKKKKRREFDKSIE